MVLTLFFYQCAETLNYFSDVIAFAGLALLGYGLFLFDPRASFIVCGTIMLVGGVYFASPDRRQPQENE